jgi:toxin-antitoxin system PIN domain toxin
MIVPDVNLLVYAYDSKAPHHPRARAWWEGLLSRREPVGIPWVVSVGFVRIMTSRSVMTEPMAPGLALTHVRSWLALPSVDPIQPGPRHLDILASFAQSGTLVSALMTDAHIAAIAVELQATVHSNDTDFARFPGLRWMNPLAGG